MYIVLNGVSRGTRISFLLSFNITVADRVKRLSETPDAILPNVVPEQGIMTMALALKEPEAILAATFSF